MSTQSHIGTPDPEKRAGSTDDSLRASSYDGVSHAVMLGLGETYLGPFVQFMGSSPLLTVS